MYEGKMVEIEANGITYRGRLVQMDEENVHLETEMGWTVVRNSDITSIMEVEEAGSDFKGGGIGQDNPAG